MSMTSFVRIVFTNQLRPKNMQQLQNFSKPVNDGPELSMGVSVKITVLSTMPMATSSIGINGTSKYHMQNKLLNR